jgi:hypothetical protein
MPFERPRLFSPLCFLWLLLALPLFSAARIDRIDLFDKAGNLLLFVTFDYDATGKNTGRSVFTGDSTFVRSTALQRDGFGAVVKETSFDFDSTPAYSTSLSRQAETTTFSIADQFGLDQLGGPMSYGESSPHTFAVSQNGGTIYNVVYQFADDGALTRINILDKSQEIVFYATVSTSTGATVPLTRAAAINSFKVHTTDRGDFRVAIELAAAGHLTLELFSLSGKRIATLMDKKFGPGSHAVFFDGRRGALCAAANGAYIYLLSINGMHYGKGKCILQR